MAGGTARLGAFVAESGLSDMAAPLRAAGLRTILNHVGCALGTARDPAVTTALAVMREISAAPVATVFGQGVRLDPMAAAFVNEVPARRAPRGFWAQLRALLRL